MCCRDIGFGSHDVKNMLKFNPKSVCVKCGWDKDHEVIFVPAFTGNDFYRAYDEHFERICSRCSYSWEEEPLDKE